MRDALTNLLCRRYPGLYQQANLPMSQTCMCWGFSCHDGWFRLIDALSETVTAIDPNCQARQVKEKFGTLHFYFGGDYDVLNSAVRTSEFYSSRVCERTGAPGDLMKTQSDWPLYATLSAEGIEQFNEHGEPGWIFEPVCEVARIQPGSKSSAEPFQVPVAATRSLWGREEAIGILRTRHEHALAAGCVIDIPRGGFDLADAVISSISRRFQLDADPTGAPVPKISRLIWGGDSGLSVKVDESSLTLSARHGIERMPEHRRRADKPVLETEITKLRRSLAAVCLFATNMSKRVDPSTGRIGPVDDDGRLRL